MLQFMYQEANVVLLTSTAGGNIAVFMENFGDTISDADQHILS